MARVDELKKIVPPGMTLPEMSLRFILSNPDVSTTIIGMRKLDHVKENIALSDAGPLDASSAPEVESASLGSHAARNGPTEIRTFAAHDTFGMRERSAGAASGYGIIISEDRAARGVRSDRYLQKP